MELMKTDSGHPKILAGHRLRQNKKSLTNLDIDQMAFKKYGQNYGPGPEDNYGGGPTLRIYSKVPTSKSRISLLELVIHLS